MTKVTLNMSMSLDGFVAGPNVSVEHAMGEDGERLHDWIFNHNSRQSASGQSGESPQVAANEINMQVTQEVFATTGAVVLGKRTFDVGLQHWKDTPYPVPCFVLTHESRAALAQTSGTFTFVTDGIESALRQAQIAAGEKDINLMGAEVAQQFLKAGLVDEIQINLVPLLLGDGLRLFEHLGTQQIELESTRVLNAPNVTHLTYRVINRVIK